MLDAGKALPYWSRTDTGRHLGAWDGRAELLLLRCAGTAAVARFQPDLSPSPALTVLGVMGAMLSRPCGILVG